MMVIAGEEARSVVRQVEAPHPSLVRQGKKAAIGGRLDVVDRVRRGLGPARGDLSIVISEDGHEGSAAKEIALRVDEIAEGLRSLDPLFVETGDIVAAAEEEVEVFFYEDGEIAVPRIPAIGEDADTYRPAAVAFEGMNRRFVGPAADAVVMSWHVGSEHDFDMVESDGFLRARFFAERPVLPKFDERGPGLSSLPVHGDPRAIIDRMGKPDPLNGRGVESGGEERAENEKRKAEHHPISAMAKIASSSSGASSRHSPSARSVGSESPPMERRRSETT